MHIPVKPVRQLLPLICVLALAACQEKPAAPAVASADAKGELFDDFSYGSTGELAGNGWTMRTAAGWPGVAGAAWGGERFALVDDTEQAGNRLLRMNAETDGSKTAQAQLCHARKYLAGTYAARVRFAGAPVSGPNGDQTVQTFYMISPLARDMDPDFSEIDFEYLHNGGWGESGPAFFMTSWETVQMQPVFKPVNQSHTQRDNMTGWHTLLVQVANDETVYYVDGIYSGRHGKPSYPRVPMSINFNLWFTAEGLLASKEKRRWEEDVDWVFHAANAVLSPEHVNARVAELRQHKVAFSDTVPAAKPALPSPCDL